MLKTTLLSHFEEIFRLTDSGYLRDYTDDKDGITEYYNASLTKR